MKALCRTNLPVNFKTKTANNSYLDRQIPCDRSRSLKIGSHVPLSKLNRNNCL